MPRAEATPRVAPQGLLSSSPAVLLGVAEAEDSGDTQHCFQGSCGHSWSAPVLLNLNWTFLYVYYRYSFIVF